MAMKAYTKHTGYKRANGKGCAQIKAHLKYIEQRPDELGQRQKREIFNEQDKVKRQDFQDKLNDIAKKHPGGVVAHKIAISIKREDFEKGKVDPKEVTRNVMAQWEAKTGQKLDWVAVFHDKGTNPHVHVVIAGRDRSGREVILTKAELEKLKNMVDKEVKRQMERNGGRAGWDISDKLQLQPLEHAQAIENKLRSVVQDLQRSEAKGRGGLGGGILKRGRDIVDIAKGKSDELEY